MITFILGEDRHVRYKVESDRKCDYIAIKEASFQLLYDGQEEASGTCEVIHEEGEGGCYVDAKLAPQKKSGLYELEITISVADEIIKHREEMRVIG